MAEEKKGLTNIFHGVVSNAIWAAVFVAGAAIFGAAGRWAKNISDFTSGILFTLACVFVAIGLVIVVTRWTQRRRSGDEPTTRSLSPAQLDHEIISVPPEPPIPAATMDRLREAYAPLSVSMRFASDCLSTGDVHVDVFCNQPEEKPKWKLVARLLESYALPELHEAQENIDRKIELRGDLSRVDYKEVCKAFDAALTKYAIAVHWIEVVGNEFFGEKEFLAQNCYANLHRRHQKALEELERAQGWQDIKGIVAPRLRDFKSLLRSPPMSQQAKLLSVRAYTDHLSHLYMESHELWTGAFEKREFAVLEVRNTSTRSLSPVVARYLFPGGVEGFCIWSLKPGTPPFDPGTHEADLSAGNSRLLVIARGFGDKELWARLPPEGQPLHIILTPQGMTRTAWKDEETTDLISQSGAELTLSKTIEVTVTFQATDFYQEEHFTLGFEDSKPTIKSRENAKNK